METTNTTTTPAATPEKVKQVRYTNKGQLILGNPAKLKLGFGDKYQGKNPKKPGSLSETWFSWYAPIVEAGGTVADYYKAGGKPDHIRWDHAHGYITVTPIE